MHIYDQTNGQDSPVARGFAISMVVSIFRGHKDVEIHLFRAHWDAEEEGQYDWQKILGEPLRRDQPVDPEGSRQVFLETLNREEKDALIDYLQTRYAAKLSSIKVSLLPLPIPIGLTPLSSVAENQKFGRIHLHKIPHYPLQFAIDGLFSLSQHQPYTEQQDVRDDF
ncbi:MAG: hypothetical protein U5L00_08725 [Desulfovermiculus sp.]|nr:hypothetical protein [Desulfovermiculus sp.]